ncbi:hypothetical protein ABIE65_004893 [Constrictibacter sp. MBR-5]|uniref:hypothetical protein n=1 Tax=Constrictibacter sp. MBR-5 TaxID=3156467 RepID=UPI0033957AF3
MTDAPRIRRATFAGFITDPDHGLMLRVGDGDVVLHRPISPVRAAEMARDLLDYAAAELRKRAA